MIPFNTLSKRENEMLLKFPAYLSLLAATHDDKLDKTEKSSAIKFMHIKTFTCDPYLCPFYKEADKVFVENIEKLDKELPKEKEARDAAIKKELLDIEKIVLKLGNQYTELMHHSMKLFKDHVSKAHHSVLVDFIFPFSIHGITDR